METTPNDLRQQQFEIKFRGYNPDDVELFRDLAASALEESRAEQLKLSEENRHLQDRLKHLISLEETLKATVLDARKNAEDSLVNSRKEAETIVAEARNEADSIVHDAEQKRSEVLAEMQRQMGKLVADINKIRYIRSNYINSLRGLVASQMETIEGSIAEFEREEKEAEAVPKENLSSLPQTVNPPSPPSPPPKTEMSAEEMNTTDSIVIPETTPESQVDEGEKTSTDQADPEVAPESSDDDWDKLREQLSDE